MEVKKLTPTQNDSFKLKNKPVSPLNLNFGEKKLTKSQPKNKNFTSFNMMKFNLKISDNHSLSENKIKKRKASLQTKIFQLQNQNKDQNIIKKYLNLKNINIIKENLKKLQQKSPKPKCYQRHSQKKMKLCNNFSFQKQQKLSYTSRKRSESQSDIFLFEKKEQSKIKNFSHRFDRSKYFNTQHTKNQQRKKSLPHQQNELSYTLVNSNKQSEEKTRIIKNYIFFDEIIPVIKLRNKKPKTSGGFLKKYPPQQSPFEQIFSQSFNDQNQIQ